MQRVLGAQATGGCQLQPSRRRHASWSHALASKSRRSICQAASTLSNGESEATAGPGTSKAATTATATTPPVTPAASTSTVAAGSAAAATTNTAWESSPGPASSSPLGAAKPAPSPAPMASTAASPAAPPAPSVATAVAPESGSSGSAAGAAAGSNSNSGSDGAGQQAQQQRQLQQEEQQQQQQQQQAASASVAFSLACLRRLAAATTPIDVAEALSAEVPLGLREEDARAVIGFCLQRGKVPLALALYREMCLARRGGRRAGGGAGGAGGAATMSLDVAFVWPAATLATTRELVLGLCQQLCIVEALQVLADMKVQGLPRGSEEVGFGKVITSPLAPDRPLTVVQPQEGAKTVADAYSRYEYDVFTGATISCSSTALVPPGGILLGLGRALGLIKKPPVAAVHEFVLQAPDSTSRAFRVGTETSAVPAQVGERLTVVSAPARNVRKGGLFNASPPGTRPGEALTATNHKTGAVSTLLRPPVSSEQAGLPGWVVPAAVVLAGSSPWVMYTSYIDPAMPVLLAAGAVSLTGSAVLSNSLLLPRLKQLPDGKVRVEYVRQQLLGQYNQLGSKAAAAMSESAEDVRVLARLWQLQNKMEATGGGGSGAASAYEARIGRVARARANIEERLARRIELLDGYSRVMNMIEIEVEMDIEVPAAEVAGIQEQVARLVELEGLQEDWRAQAEARDEVERLLRTA